VTLLDVRGLKRKLSPSNIVIAAQLLVAVARCVRLFGHLRPKVVLSVGGYASVPAVLAAKLRRIPIVVVSYDAVPGLANRLAARLARACAVAFETAPVEADRGKARPLPHAVVTGTPVRDELLAVEPERDRAAARLALDLPAGRFTLLVFGGSLGSGILNEVTAAYVARHADRQDLAVRHVVGERNLADAPAGRDGRDGIVHQVVGYEDQMALAYAAADLVVARAGATTVAELSALGLPSVLVPWSLATEDHQTANAQVLAGVGAAVLVPESEFDADRLDAEVERLRHDPEALAAMAAAARTAGRRDAAAAIARLVESCAKP
jgi:UDP-N-acetylglucosamine--N-acetylmuramyl-(pentapeptide) pyrophosphoryl-undecaprenol N-acetylglucosamine transferase